MSVGRVPVLRVEVSSAPSPHLLRAAIARRIVGGRFTPGPEDAIGEAVARAVAGQLIRPDKEPRWR